MGENLAHARTLRPFRDSASAKKNGKIGFAALFNISLGLKISKPFVFASELPRFRVISIFVRCSSILGEKVQK